MNWLSRCVEASQSCLPLDSLLFCRAKAVMELYSDVLNTEFLLSCKAWNKVALKADLPNSVSVSVVLVITFLLRVASLCQFNRRQDIRFRFAPCLQPFSLWSMRQGCQASPTDEEKLNFLAIKSHASKAAELGRLAIHIVIEVLVFQTIFHLLCWSLIVCIGTNGARSL